MAEINGGRLIARQLKAAGVDRIFTVAAGPMVQTLVGAVEEGIEVVNCRHDMSAALAASAYGYVQRKPGVVVVGSGPGTTNAITPLYVATESAMPLVVLGGSMGSSPAGLGQFQEVDQVRLAAPASKWAGRVQSINQIPDMLHLALGKSVAGRPGGVYLDFSGRIIAQTIDDTDVVLRDAQPGVTTPQPEPSGVARIADMLATAERPLVVIGKGAAWADAGAPLRRLIDRGIPFVASPMGRGTVPDDHQLCMASARNTALRNADMVLMVGARFNWIFQQGRQLAEGVRIAQIDVEAEEMWSGVDVEVGLVADCAAALDAINAALEGRSLRVSAGDWVDTLLKSSQENQEAVAEWMASDQTPIDHYRMAAEVRDCLPRDAIVTEDAELTMGITRQIVPSFFPRQRLNSGTTGCMGTGFPYAVGAKLACPDKPVVAILGDYAFGAAAMEVETCARLGINVTIIVSNNAGISAHTMQARFPEGSPPVGAMLPVDYEKMAEMVGGYAECVTEPAAIRPALQRALASDTVSLLNILTDPNAGKGRRSSMYI